MGVTSWLTYRRRVEGLFGEWFEMSKREIEEEDLLRLRLAVALAPELHARGAHPAALHDVVERAVASKSFKLGLEGTLIDGGTGAVRDFIDDLQHSASFLFQVDERPGATDERVARQAEADRIANLSPLKKLELANARIARERGAL